MTSLGSNWASPTFKDDGIPKKCMFKTYQKMRVKNYYLWMTWNEDLIHIKRNWKFTTITK